MQGSEGTSEFWCNRSESGGCSQTMEHELRMGLSVWSIVAIICNSVAAVLILILFGILYKACQVPSQQEKVLVTTEPEQKTTEQKYLLTAGWWSESLRKIDAPPDTVESLPFFPNSFCFCCTSLMWFVELTDPRVVARPTTISLPNPLICAVCCSTVHLPGCLFCSTQAAHASLFYSLPFCHSSIWDKRSCRGKTAKSQWIKTGSLVIVGLSKHRSNQAWWKQYMQGEW